MLSGKALCGTLSQGALSSRPFGLMAGIPKLEGNMYTTTTKYIPAVLGSICQYYLSTKTPHAGLLGVFILATLLLGCHVSKVSAATVTATLRTLSGNNAPAAGTRLVIYTSPSRQVSGSNPATFANVAAGTYTMEGYYTGTFWGEEFWDSRDVTVPASGTVSPILTRNTPYVSSVVIKNHATGATITSGQSVQAGTQLRIEVTIQNNLSVALNCRPHVLVDQSQSSPYDFDLTWTSQSVSSGGSRLFSTTFTPRTTGQYYFAYESMTTLLNGNTVRTDSAGWQQTFQIVCPIPSAPSSPNPADGATGVSPSLSLLNWADISGAVSYDVYFGTSTSPAYQGNTTSSQWPVSSLLENTTYYWKVVAINSCGSTTGARWSFTTARIKGDVNATLNTAGGAAAPPSGTRVVLYTSPSRQVSGSNPAFFANAAPGTYTIEGYYTGTFWGEEYWSSQQVMVSAGQTSSPTLPRQYPYITAVVIKNHATGTTITPGQSIMTGTQLRAEVTVRNDVPGTTLNCAVHLAADLSQSAPYDFDLNSGAQSVGGSGGTRTYTLTFTPVTTGQFYYAYELMTTLENGNTVRTDSAGWSQTANIIPCEGTIIATLKDLSANNAPAAGTRLAVLTNPARQTTAVNPATFSSVPCGTYTVEGYYTGTFWGEEYWASAQLTLTSGQTANLSLPRQYPYITGVVIKNHATGTTIPAGQSVPLGTQLRAEVTVRNDVPGTSLNCAVRLVVDKSQSSPYDIDLNSGAQAVSGGSSTRLYTLTFTPSTTGQHYFSYELLTTLANGNTVPTDSAGWTQTANMIANEATVVATLRNVSGNNAPAAGTRLVLLTSPSRELTGANPGTFSAVPVGTYYLEGYYTGTFWGEEYWSSQQLALTTGQTVSPILTRQYPYATAVTIKNHATGATIAPGQAVLAGTQLRVEVVVRNDVPGTPLNCQAHVAVDLSQSSPYDQNLTSTFQSVAGSSGALTFTMLFTPISAGQYSYATEVNTTLGNGNTVRTDSIGWQKTFQIVDISLTSATFSKTRYSKGDAVSGSFTVRNGASTPLQNITLEAHFKNPRGLSVGGVTSAPFTVNANSSATTPSLSIWTMPSTAFSGAYVPIVTLRDSGNNVLATYEPTLSNSVLPVIPMGLFPRLNSLIVRSQEHFNSSDAASVGTILQQLHDAGIYQLSLLVKLDDGAGLWSSLSPRSGQLLFTSANVTPSGSNPLSYDLLQRAQASAANLGMRVDLWIPTFYDKAALTDHPSWVLAVGAGQNQQDFIDASLPAVRSYEASVILDATRAPYVQPSRVTIDHFRYTYGQHEASYITQFASDLKASLPAGTQLAGYMWLPGDTWWSGQDYNSLEPYLDVMSPMMYWQSGALSSSQTVPEAAGVWTSNSVQSIVNSMGLSTTQAKVVPCISITSSGNYSEGGTYSLDDLGWRRTQLNVLGALGDFGIGAYDLFYHGNWLWLVDGANPALGKWADRAKYLSTLGPNCSPTDLALSSATIMENQPSGTAVGVFSSSDPDTGNTFTYTLVSGTGAADNSSFTISGNSLLTAAPFNYESRNSYSIRVRSTDQGGLYIEKAFTITVLDVNEQPTDISISGASVPEHKPSGTAVGSFATTDPDTGNTFTYSLVSGTGSDDNGSFSLSGSTLQTAVSFNYESRSNYSVRVRSTDQGGLYVEKAFTVTITDVAEKPSTPSNVSPPNGALNQPLTLTLQASAFSDPDAGSTHSASQWIVRRSGDYAIVFDSGEDAAHRTSCSIPADRLMHATIYTWQVRYKDNTGLWSDYSVQTSFGTVAPAVAARLQSGTIIFTWPTNAPGFILMSTTNLATNAVWTKVFPAPVVVSGQNVVSNTISEPRLFYRLKK